MLLLLLLYSLTRWGTKCSPAATRKTAAGSGADAPGPCDPMSCSRLVPLNLTLSLPAMTRGSMSQCHSLSLKRCTSCRHDWHSTLLHGTGPCGIPAVLDTRQHCPPMPACAICTGASLHIPHDPAFPVVAASKLLPALLRCCCYCCCCYRPPAAGQPPGPPGAYVCCLRVTRATKPDLMACTVLEAPHCWQRKCMSLVAESLSSRVSTDLQPGHNTYLQGGGKHSIGQCRCSRVIWVIERGGFTAWERELCKELEHQCQRDMLLQGAT